MSEQAGSHDNDLPGWRQQQQKKIGVNVVSERKDLPSKYPTASEQLHPLVLLTRLTGHAEIMAFPDYSTSLLPHHVTQHYPEQSEFEDKGGINPFKSDTDSKSDQPQHQQRVQADKYIDSYPSLLMDRKKPSRDVHKPLHNALYSCNVDFSDLWMVS